MAAPRCARRTSRRKQAPLGGYKIEDLSRDCSHGEWASERTRVGLLVSPFDTSACRGSTRKRVQRFHSRDASTETQRGETERNVHDSTHGIGRGDAATPPAITDIVAARNGGERVRVNFPSAVSPPPSPQSAGYVPLFLSRADGQSNVARRSRRMSVRSATGDVIQTRVVRRVDSASSIVHSMVAWSVPVCVDTPPASLCLLSNAGIHIL